MSLTPNEIQRLLRAAEEAGWGEIRIDTDDTTLVVSSDPDTTVHGAATSAAEDAAGAAATSGTAPEPDTAGTGERGIVEEASAPAEVTEVSGPEGGMHVIASPSVGVFWRAPKPGAPPFVEVGDDVAPDDTVCIIEVMKLMNHIKAEIYGTIVEIHPQNGEMVEFEAPLMTVEPA